MQKCFNIWLSASQNKSITSKRKILRNIVGDTILGVK